MRGAANALGRRTQQPPSHEWRLGVGRNIGQCFDGAERAFHTVKANRTIVIYVTFSGYAEPVTSRVSPQDPQKFSRRSAREASQR
jgi:hypothetical protein